MIKKKKKKKNEIERHTFTFSFTAYLRGVGTVGKKKLIVLVS